MSYLKFRYLIGKKKISVLKKLLIFILLRSFDINNPILKKNVKMSLS